MLKQLLGPHLLSRCSCGVGHQVLGTRMGLWAGMEGRLGLVWFLYPRPQ